MGMTKESFEDELIKEAFAREQAQYCGVRLFSINSVSPGSTSVSINV